jgi:segregation and condensation protein A
MPPPPPPRRPLGRGPHRTPTPRPHDGDHPSPRDNAPEPETAPATSADAQPARERREGAGAGVAPAWPQQAAQDAAPADVPAPASDAASATAADVQSARERREGAAAGAAPAGPQQPPQNAVPAGVPAPARPEDHLPAPPEAPRPAAGQEPADAGSSPVRDRTTPAPRVPAPAREAGGRSGAEPPDTGKGGVGDPASSAAAADSGARAGAGPSASATAAAGVPAGDAAPEAGGLPGAEPPDGSKGGWVGNAPAPAAAASPGAAEVSTGAAGDAEDTEPAEGGDAGSPAEAVVGDGGFRVRLANFEGPFDLLLQLISKHKLDVTEVALSKVTDEFIAHIRAMGPDWDLDQATGFLVVAATLLDLKAARLLPAAEVEDEEDLALLEARDLLFARLLQYRAYKEIAAIFAARWAEELHRHPRTVGLEPHHAELLPEVVISIGPEGFARIAAKAMVPKPKPAVYVEHIHAPLVSVREQAEVVVARLRELGRADFRTLTEDAPDTLTVVARFLALLELYREKAVALDQEEALGELVVRWTGDTGHQPVVTDEFDQETGEERQNGKRT